MMVRECTSTCFVLLVAVVPAWDTKDRFVERVTMTTAQSAGLIWVGLVEQHDVFPVMRISGAEGLDGKSWTQVMEGVLLATAQAGASVGWEIRSGETLVWLSCRLGRLCERLCGNLLAVHLRQCTFGNMETLSH